MAIGKIITADQEIKVKNTTILVYGQPGIGKTSLGFTTHNPLLLDCDAGAHRSAFRRKIVAVENWTDIASITADDIAEYDTICIDTVGRLLDFLAADIIRNNPKMGYNGALSLQGYGQLKSLFASWIKTLRTMNKDVVMLAHDREEKRGDETVFRPDIQGGSYSEVMKIADSVGYLSTGVNKQAVLDFWPSDKHIGKNVAHLDLQEVPDFNSVPDFGNQLIAKIKESMNSMSNEGKMIVDLVSLKRKEYESATNADEFQQALQEIASLPSMAQTACKRVLWEQVKKNDGIEFKDGVFLEKESNPASDTESFDNDTAKNDTPVSNATGSLQALYN